MAVQAGQPAFMWLQAAQPASSAGSAGSGSRRTREAGSACRSVAPNSRLWFAAPCRGGRQQQREQVCDRSKRLCAVGGTRSRGWQRRGSRRRRARQRPRCLAAPAYVASPATAAVCCKRPRACRAAGSACCTCSCGGSEQGRARGGAGRRRWARGRAQAATAARCMRWPGSDISSEQSPHSDEMKVRGGLGGAGRGPLACRQRQRRLRQ